MRCEILRMENIITAVGGIRLVDYAKLNLFKGEILGLVGLNYSGKTALVGGINGRLPYTSGVTYYQEEKVEIASVRQANELGIFYIDPQFNLLPDCTIAENIYIKDNANKSLLYHARDCRKRAQEILQAMHMNLSVDTFVYELTYREKILVAICKAVANHARIIILDCVLSALAKNKRALFSELFTMLKAQGIAIILIEQTLNSIRPYCERWFVMRQGSTVGEFITDEIDDNTVVSLMMGRPIEKGKLAQTLPARIGLEEILSFENVYYNGVLKNLNLHVYRNESLGILNWNKHSGAAIDELLSGKGMPSQGTIKFNGQAVKLKDTKAGLKTGIGIVSEMESLCEEMSLEENILISVIAKHRGRFGFLNRNDFKYIKSEIMMEYFMQEKQEDMTDLSLPTGWLMRKKVAFCRALAAEPELMVLVNPTQYMDMISKKEFYEDISSLKRKQISVLLVSADIEEIIEVCDRVVVVQEGNAVESFVINEQNSSEIINKYGEYLKEEN